MSLIRTIALVTGVLNTKRRGSACQALAQYLGAESFLLFLRDSEAGVPLPPPGFPQTLPEGWLWRKFLKETLELGRHQAELPVPGLGGGRRHALGIAGPNGSAAVLAGGSVREDRLKECQQLLPLLVAALEGELEAMSAAGHAAVAREAAEQAQTLVQTLDETRQRLQQALIEAEAANLAKDGFLATVSHELRTPLTAILGWGKLLQDPDTAPADVRRAVAAIERNAKAQTQLVDDLLDISRIVSGNFRLSLRPVDLRELIRASVGEAKAAAQAKRIAIATDLPEESMTVLGDGGRLRQVFGNLLSNAIKFSALDSRVLVQLRRTGSWMEITVADAGKGIRKDFLPHVFELFRQADPSSTRQHEGLGLGLAIARRMVELHGGTISASSEGDNRGAVFVLRLPAVATDPEGAGEASAATGRGGLHVMVVDDDPETIELLRMALQRAGARVTAASSDGEALRQIRRSPPDVIIKDIGMRAAEGPGFVEGLRVFEAEAGRRIPMIALMADAGLKDQGRALAEGYEVVQPKPVQPAELVRDVTRLAGSIHAGNLIRRAE